MGQHSQKFSKVKFYIFFFSFFRYIVAVLCYNDGTFSQSMNRINELYIGLNIDHVNKYFLTENI